MIAFKIRITRITNGSTNAVTLSSPSSNNARIWKKKKKKETRRPINDQQSKNWNSNPNALSHLKDTYKWNNGGCKEYFYQ